MNLFFPRQLRHISKTRNECLKAVGCERLLSDRNAAYTVCTLILLIIAPKMKIVSSINTCNKFIKSYIHKNTMYRTVHFVVVIRVT